MKSKLQATLLATIAIIALSNCTGKKETAESQTDAEATAVDSKTDGPSAPQFAVDAAFQQQMAGLFKAYISLKDAFVATDAVKVKSEAALVGQALSKIDMKLLNGPAHHDWMNYQSGLESSLKEMLASDDIEVQRTAFKNLSDNLYKSIKAFGLGGTTAFYEYCPMAFDNTGAYWLSSEEKIRNPYFGDKMLTCGSVEETLN